MLIKNVILWAASRRWERFKICSVFFYTPCITCFGDAVIYLYYCSDVPCMLLEKMETLPHFSHFTDILTNFNDKLLWLNGTQAAKFFKIGLKWIVKLYFHHKITLRKWNDKATKMYKSFVLDLDATTFPCNKWIWLVEKSKQSTKNFSKTEVDFTQIYFEFFVLFVFSRCCCQRITRLSSPRLQLSSKAELLNWLAEKACKFHAN